MLQNGSECVKLLLHYDNIDVDVKDHLRRTPVMYAIINEIESTTIGIEKRSQ